LRVRDRRLLPGKRRLVPPVRVTFKRAASICSAFGHYRPDRRSRRSRSQVQGSHQDLGLMAGGRSQRPCMELGNNVSGPDCSLLTPAKAGGPEDGLARQSEGRQKIRSRLLPDPGRSRSHDFRGTVDRTERAAACKAGSAAHWNAKYRVTEFVRPRRRLMYGRIGEHSVRAGVEQRFRGSPAS
jgi:hypothetical protein